MGNEKIGQKIKKFRLRAGLSQFELEDQIGASPGSLSRIENGLINPTKETIIKLIEALDLKSYDAASLFNLDFDELPKMVDIARKLSSSLELDQVLQNAVNEVVQELDLIGSVIFLIEQDTLYARTLTQSWYTSLVLKILNTTKLELQISLKMETENIFVKCVRTKESYLSDNLADFTRDVLSDNVVKLCIKVTGHRSAIVFPLVYEDKSIGAILFSKNYYDNFSKEYAILKSFSEHITLAVVNAQKYQQIKEELEVLKNGK